GRRRLSPDLAPGAGLDPLESTAMDAFEMAELVAWREQTGELYHEFLRRPSMSLGLYVLDAGADDPQSPHDEDEVYYVVAGRAAITVAGERRDVVAGSVVFVPAGAEHRFHDIAERLELLVVFAPAQSGSGGNSRGCCSTREPRRV